MNRLFTTFGRAALVALGLAAAPAAHAQLCGGGTSPVWTGDGTSSASYTCALSCTGGQVATVTGDTVSCTGGGGGPVAPAGCKIVASPTSGPSGSNVQLTLSCTSGDLPININWSGTNKPASCPNQLTGSLSANCTASSVTQTTTWTITQFSNAVGNGTGNANKSATFTVQAGGGGGGGVDFSSCPAGTQTFNPGYGTYQNPGNPIYIEAGGTASFAMVVPAGTTTGVKTSTWSYYGWAGDWIYTVSDVACDMLGTMNVQWGNSKGKPAGYPLKGASQNGGATFYYAVGSDKNLQAGKTYYFNIRAISNTGIIGGLPSLP